MSKTNSLVSRTKILLSPDSSRVVLRKFNPDPESRISSIVGRINALSEKEVARNLKVIVSRFSKKHLQTEETLLAHYESVKSFFDTDYDISAARKLLIGAYFTNEYAFESAALFNPSIVSHPDQSGLPAGSVRFIMSLRATGEGHISSLTFRTGVIDSSCTVSIDPVSQYAAVAPPMPDSPYDKVCFRYKLAEMRFDNEFSRSVLAPLPDFFTINQLQESLSNLVRQNHRYSENDKLVHDKILWLAHSNYGVSISERHPLSYWVIFPASPSEKNGIEDARFVRFIDDDGSSRYYATYTAYDGRVILPQLLETDFKNFKMITLNGSAVQNKGMALFPRRINGNFAMLSRQDNESIFLMYSDNIHFWHEAVRIVRPKYDWEFMKIGNCGSPIETDIGWLVLTHGVGPFRQYSIGALLLDRSDPSKVLGRLAEPILFPTGIFRDGYVPNVVYTCGYLVHKDKLIVPYALSDWKITIAIIDLRHLLQLLQAGI
ncbi:MAG: glycoside hydrolase family 130 protein [Candidatus Sumerlaeota bacterium]|nr:glycoside hydrolase family 130 protein [Candidatus Sumerlaeota bacterium]